MSSLPKIVHYCWMSNDNWDDKTKKCFLSWKNFIVDYEFKLWNSETLPIEVLEKPTVRNAIKNKKWAFVADYVRMWALYNYGGLYMDLDVQLLKCPTEILNNDIIFGLEKNQIGGHFIATKPKHPFIKYVLNKLEAKTNFMPLPQYISECYINYYNRSVNQGKFNDITIYPNDYFNPFLWNDKSNKGELKLTENTYCIHWYAGSWIPKYKRTAIYQILINIFDRLGMLHILRKIRGY